MTAALRVAAVSVWLGVLLGVAVAWVDTDPGASVERWVDHDGRFMRCDVHDGGRLWVCDVAGSAPIRIQPQPTNQPTPTNPNALGGPQNDITG